MSCSPHLLQLFLLKKPLGKILYVCARTQFVDEGVFVVVSPKACDSLSEHYRFVTFFLHAYDTITLQITSMVVFFFKNGLLFGARREENVVCRKITGLFFAKEDPNRGTERVSENYDNVGNT